MKLSHIALRESLISPGSPHTSFFDTEKHGCDIDLRENGDVVVTLKGGKRFWIPSSNCKGGAILDPDGPPVEYGEGEETLADAVTERVAKSPELKGEGPPFPCPQCEAKPFWTRRKLENHVKRKHREQPLQP